MEPNKFSKIYDISVVMCTYNGSQYLEQQIKSVLAQTYPISEFVVVDDCSTDDTYEILCRYQQQNPNLFRIYRNENTEGVNRNFLYALNLAECNYIAPCDQDDIWLPNKLAMCVELFSEDDVIMTFCQDGIFTDDYETTTPTSRESPTLDDMIFCKGGVWGHTMLFKKKLLTQWRCVENMLWDTSLTLCATTQGKILGTQVVGCCWRRHLSAFSLREKDDWSKNKKIVIGGV